MTLVIGFKTRDAVFLTADTAITSTSHLPMAPDLEIGRMPRSSFSETIIDGPHRKVRERMIKTFQVNDRTIVGIAGSVWDALDVVFELQLLMAEINYQNVSTVVSITERAVRTHLRNSGIFTIELLIGFVNQDGPHLIIFKDGKASEYTGLVGFIGGYTADHQKRIMDLMSRIVGVNHISPLDHSSILCCMNAALQTFTFEQQTFGFGIGGAFLGLYATADLIKRPPDTFYFILNGDDIESGVDIRFRSEIAVVRSLENSSKAFLDPIKYDGITEGDASQLLQHIKQEPNIDSYLFFTFLSRNNNGILVLKRSPGQASGYVPVFSFDRDHLNIGTQIPFSQLFDGNFDHFFFRNDQYFQGRSDPDKRDWHFRGIRN